jgi:hypothetical protein
MVRKTVLAIDLGTFCDNQLMDTCMGCIAERHKIIYFTDKKHKIPFRTYKVESFDTPHFFVDDPKLPAADTGKNITPWLVQHPKRAFAALAWGLEVRSRLLELLDEYQVDAMMVLYPAFSLVWHLPLEVLQSIPTYIIYYAPGFVNTKVPWLFDSVLRKPDFSLYNTSAELNVKSGKRYVNRLNKMALLANGGGNAGMTEKMECLHHVIAWDKHITPEIVPHFVNMTKTHYIGGIVQNKTKKKKREVLPALPKADEYIFMSFGSYGSAPGLKKRLEHIIRQLETFCAAAAADNKVVRVIFHNGHLDTQYITSIQGYIPYGVMVPKCRLVVFTGSACLQNICFYHKVPMHFVPLLAEQYFWARNYCYFTGTSLDKIDFEQNIRTRNYLDKVSDSMQSYDCADELLKLMQW